MNTLTGIFGSTIDSCAFRPKMTSQGKGFSYYMGHHITSHDDYFLFLNVSVPVGDGGRALMPDFPH